MLTDGGSIPPSSTNYFLRSNILAKKHQSHLLHADIDQVYVLSVKSFKDRISHIQDQMTYFGIPFPFIFDYDIPELSKDILKKLGYNKFYEHIPYIKDKLGIKPPVMTQQLEEQLCNLFMEIQGPYAKYCPDDRVNFLNYYFLDHFYI